MAVINPRNSFFMCTTLLLKKPWKYHQRPSDVDDDDDEDDDDGDDDEDNDLFVV